MSTMAKKSFKKRIKVTKTGKLLRRTQGQSHARANKSGQVINRKKRTPQVSGVDRKTISAKLK